ncbi:ppk14 [Symbiodinium microadriaticum]|nr:ppk14 [Symbiodinium microadriaticum]
MWPRDTWMDPSLYFPSAWRCKSATVRGALARAYAVLSQRKRIMNSLRVRCLPTHSQSTAKSGCKGGSLDDVSEAGLTRASAFSGVSLNRWTDATPRCLASVEKLAKSKRPVSARRREFASGPLANVRRASSSQLSLVQSFARAQAAASASSASVHAGSLPGHLADAASDVTGLDSDVANLNDLFDAEIPGPASEPHCQLKPLVNRCDAEELATLFGLEWDRHEYSKMPADVEKGRHTGLVSFLFSRSVGDQLARVLDGLRQEQVRALGAGGFGSVIKVVDKRTQKFYAMKLQAKDRATKYAVREAQALHASDHAFIVGLVHIFQTSAHYCIVMELCAENLNDRILRSGREGLAPTSAAKYTACIVLALEYLHGQAKTAGGLEAFNELSADLDSVMIGTKILHYHAWMVSETIAEDVKSALQAGHRTDRCKLSERALFCGDMSVLHGHCNYWGHRASITLLSGDDTSYPNRNHNVMKVTSEQAAAVQISNISSAGLGLVGSVDCLRYKVATFGLPLTAKFEDFDHETVDPNDPASCDDAFMSDAIEDEIEDNAMRLGVTAFKIYPSAYLMALLITGQALLVEISTVGCPTPISAGLATCRGLGVVYL